MLSAKHWSIFHDHYVNRVYCVNIHAPYVCEIVGYYRSIKSVLKTKQTKKPNNIIIQKLFTVFVETVA